MRLFPLRLVRYRSGGLRVILWPWENGYGEILVWKPWQRPMWNYICYYRKVFS